MKVVVTGTRGIPLIQGGVETHCQNLYPQLARLGCDVTVVRRACYVTEENRITEYEGVHLTDVYAPRRKSLEAIVHTTLATFKARRLGADIIHIHTVGPSLVTPLARLLGMKVVCTNHGPDYRRAKWGRVARWCIRLGERWQVRWAHHIIAISDNIADSLRKNYRHTPPITIIPNGVNAPEEPTNYDYLDNLGLQQGKYVLAMARFVPEKRLHLLIEAFSRCETKGYKLVIAGDADHDDDYSRRLKAQAADAGAILTGYVTGDRLSQLLYGAALFALPSSHEGLPIALLEAMACRRDVLVSDIEANRLPELNDGDFFVTDSADSLTEALRHKLDQPVKERTYDMSTYDWSQIARQTLNVYQQLLNP